MIPFFVRKLGAGSVENVAIWSGLVLTVTPFLVAICAPFWGIMADRYGIKLMVQRALSLSTLMIGGMAVVHTFPQLLGLRVGLGLLGGYAVMSVALMTDTVTEVETGPALGQLQAGRVVGMAMGPLWGGAVASLWGERPVFLVAALISGINYLLITTKYTPLKLAPLERPGMPQDTFSLRRLNSVPNYVAILGILFLISFSESSIDPIIPLTVEAHMPTSQAVPLIAGITITLGRIGSAFSAYMSGRLHKRHHPRDLLFISLLGGSFCALLLGLANSSWALSTWRLALGLAVGAALPLAFSLANLTVPTQGRASAFTLLSSGGLLGGAIAPLCAGLLVTTGLHTAFFVAAVLYILSDILLRSAVNAKQANLVTKTE